MARSTLPVRVEKALARAEEELAGEAEAKRIEQAANAENTRRTYDTAWRTYLKWCALQRIEPLGAADEDEFANQLRRYLAVRRNKCKLTTLAMDLVVIDRERMQALLPRVRNHPIIVRFWAALRTHRRARSDRKRKARAIDPPLLRKMVDAQPDDLRGVRNRALMLLGFHCAMRRSELCELQFQDVTMAKSSMTVRITHSKTDQTWEGRSICIKADKTAHCPVKAMRLWLEVLQEKPAESPLFASIRGRHGKVTARAMTGNSVLLLVKRSIDTAGVESDGFSGHSFRAGFVTTAYRNRVPIARIMQITGHTTEKMVMEYVRGVETTPAIANIMEK